MGFWSELMNTIDGVVNDKPPSADELTKTNEAPAADMFKGGTMTITAVTAACVGEVRTQDEGMGERVDAELATMRNEVLEAIGVCKIEHVDSGAQVDSVQVANAAEQSNERQV